jgi:erythronate-4-phosphate dehydrogenase
MKIVADANIPFVAECFSSIGDVTVVGGRQMPPDVVANADVLLVRSITPVNADLLVGSKVRFVATATIGVDHVDTDYLQRQGIGFASAPGSNANSAAEYVIAGMLEMGQKYEINLANESIGIVGVGNVGSRVAAKCAALGMDVRLNDPPLQRQTGDARYLPLKELCSCDFITLHTPLTFEGQDKTYHLANEEFFGSLKPGCVFVNASRGGVVDTGALKTAIRSGRLKAVVLDVWEGEPEIDTELLQMIDIGTPHIAGYSLDGKVNGLIMIYDSVCEYFSIEPKFDVEDFLPEPAVPELTVNPDSRSENEVLLEAVSKVYSITTDDAALREMLGSRTADRGKFFDNLRRNYPVRREFQSTTVFVEDEANNLVAKLAGIGFEVKMKK